MTYHSKKRNWLRVMDCHVPVSWNGRTWETTGQSQVFDDLICVLVGLEVCEVLHAAQVLVLRTTSSVGIDVLLTLLRIDLHRSL